MSEMINRYLNELRATLAGADPATVQDALSDAEEHLRTALDQTLSEHPETSENEVVELIIEKYGSPEEVASAYKEVEMRTAPALAESVNQKDRSVVARIFGVLIDPRAYAALLYLIISLATGIIYFTWAVTGLSLSAGFMVLIIGIPFFGVFLLSVQGLALVEGRIVEALTGYRMPRRPIFARKDLGIWGRFKYLVTSGLTWKTLVYMILQLPLGIIYFTLSVVMLAISFWCILRPIFEYGFDLPWLMIDNISFYTPGWTMPLIMIVGILWLILTMHLVKLIGRLHGGFARVMLVKKEKVADEGRLESAIPSV